PARRRRQTQGGVLHHRERRGAHPRGDQRRRGRICDEALRSRDIADQASACRHGLSGTSRVAAVLRPERFVPAAAPVSRASDAETIRVMIVDDSLTVRTVFSRMIDREADLAVVADADTAEKALLALRSTDVDVILLDLEMPGMGGI